MGQRLVRLVYCSRIAPEAMTALEAALQDILAASIRNNRLAAITGLLVAHGDWFLQALEGPERNVEERFDVIRRDPRHASAQILSWEPTTQRLFGGWAMCAKQLSPTDAAILAVLAGRPRFEPRVGSGPDVLRLLQAVASVHETALTRQANQAGALAA